MKNILGKKIGMTHIFKNGKVVPVTVISSGPCTVVYKKEKEKDGYSSIALGYEEQKEHRVTKPLKGVFKKSGLKPMKLIKEFRTEDVEKYNIGDELKVDIFEGTKYVDISGFSKGRGFQGGMKRHGFSGGPASHGASLFHRQIGSVGSRTKVQKGKKMPGRYGNEKVTIQNLEIMDLDLNNNLIIVKGAIPGAKNGYLTIRPAVKKRS